MKNTTAIILSITAAIIIGVANYFIIESHNREWLLWLHIVSPIVGAITVWLISYLKAGLNIYSVLYMIPFGFFYWIFYDWTLGFLLTGSIWHIGTTGIDVHLRQIFINGFGLFVFKLFWGVLSLTIVDRLFYYSNYDN
jgi:hypothetical protein